MRLVEEEGRAGLLELLAIAGVVMLGEHDHFRIRRVLPDVPEFIAPMVYALPVQLLAYHTAVFMGTDVDQPRNLAKSVTVE